MQSLNNGQGVAIILFMCIPNVYCTLTGMTGKQECPEGSNCLNDSYSTLYCRNDVSCVNKRSVPISQCEEFTSFALVCRSSELQKLTTNMRIFVTELAITTHFKWTTLSEKKRRDRKIGRIWGCIREYWMLYRWSGFLVVEWFGSFPPYFFSLIFADSRSWRYGCPNISSIHKKFCIFYM